MARNVQELLLRINADTKKLNAALGTSKGKVTGFSSSLKSLKGSFLAIAAVVTAVIYTFKKFIDMTADFERQFANVSTLLDLTTEEFKSLRSGVLRLAGGMGSATEMTKGLYQTISAGITDPAKALKFLELAGKAAAAGLATTFESVDLGTSVLNAFGLESDKVGKIFDQVQATIRLGKTTFGELASTVGRAAPVFHEAGLKSEELLASIAALTKQGISTDIAVTGLRQAVMQIIKPTEEAQEIWEKYGISNAAAMLKSKGLAQTLQFVKEKVGDNNTELTKLFGNVRAYTAVAPLASGAAEDFADAIDQVTNSRGELDKAYGKVKDTFEYQMKETIEKLKAAIIEELLPALEAFATWLKENQKSLDNWIKGLKDLIKNIKEIGRLYEKYPKIFNKLIAATQPLIGMYKKYNKLLTAYNKLVTNRIKKDARLTLGLKAINRGSKELNAKFKRLITQGKSVGKALDILRKGTDKLSTEFRKNIHAVREQEKALLDSKEAIEDNTDATGDASDSYHIERGQLSETTLALYRYQDAIKKGVMPAYKDLLVAMKHFSDELTIEEQMMKTWAEEAEEYFDNLLKKMNEVDSYELEPMPEPPSPDNWNIFINNLKTEFKDLAEDAGTKLGDMFVQMILDAKNWKEALVGFIKAVGIAFLNLFAQILAKWIMKLIIDLAGLNTAMKGVGGTAGSLIPDFEGLGHAIGGTEKTATTATATFLKLAGSMAAWWALFQVIGSMIYAPGSPLGHQPPGLFHEPITDIGGGAPPGRWGGQHGGVITRPTLALIGENPALNPEFLFNRPQMEALTKMGMGAGTNNIAININGYSGDPHQLAEIVWDKLTQKLRYNRRGL